MVSNYQKKQQRKKKEAQQIRSAPQSSKSAPPAAATSPHSAATQRPVFSAAANAPARSANSLVRKDQQRARWAYEKANLRAGRDRNNLGNKDKLKDYENAVQTFAAAVLRSGLAVAVSVLERDSKREAPKSLLQDLVELSVPGISIGQQQVTWQQLSAQVRGITALDTYMLATRELLKQIEWLRRACRAVRAVMDSQEAEKKPVAVGE